MGPDVKQIHMCVPVPMCVQSLSCGQHFVAPWTVAPPGSSAHGISQARILEWVAISFSRGSSWPREPASPVKNPGRILYNWATWEAQRASAQFSSSVVSNSLWPHGLQHTRPPCPSPTPRACSNSCPSSQWCLPTISSSVIPFSTCLQSFPASGSFPVSQFFTSGGQSFCFSISPSNEYSGLISFRTDWLDLLAVQGALKSLLQHHSSKALILQCSAFFRVQLSHPYMTTGKTIALTRWTFVDKVMSLLFNKLSRLVITFLFDLFHSKCVLLFHVLHPNFPKGFQLP